MGCVLCNLILLSEKEEPFPSESARQDFMNELAGDIAQNHPELVEEINACLTRRKAREKKPKKIEVLKAILDSQVKTDAVPSWTRVRTAIEERDGNLSLLVPEKQVGLTFDKTGEKFLGIYNWKD